MTEDQAIFGLSHLQAVSERDRWRQRQLALDAVRRRSDEHRQRAQRAQRALAAQRKQAALLRSILLAQAQALELSLLALQAAGRRLDDASRLLVGEHGVGQLMRVRAELVARRCRMATQVRSLTAL